MPRPATIGVLSPYLGGTFFSRVLEGIQQRVQRHGHRMVVIRSFTEQPHSPTLAWEQVDGWIALPFTVGLERIVAAAKPLVTVSWKVPWANCPTVIADNETGVRLSVRHLIEHGHTRIGFCGYIGNEEIRERYQIYCETLAEAGLSADPNLLFECSNTMPNGGQEAAGALMARGMPCSAIVTGTDMNALGLMQALQSAGYHIPEDLAVIGFDDVTETQFADPPLTTVRQRIDALGSEAAELLIDMLEGRPVSPTLHTIPTQLIKRVSCGCTPLERGLPTPAPADLEALARQMVSQLIAPAALAPATAPSDIWPDIDLVLRAFRAALTGAEAPPPDAVERAWRQTAKLSTSPGTLLSLVYTLRRATYQTDLLQDKQRAERVEHFCEQSRQILMHAVMGYHSASVDWLAQLMQANYSMTIELLSGDQETIQSLAWLDPTPALWGCMGLWEDAGTRSTLVVVGNYSRGPDFPSVPIGQRIAAHNFPPNDMVPRTDAGEPHTVTLLPITSPTRDWGVLAIVGVTGVEMISDRGNLVMWGLLLSAALERSMLMDSLRTQQETLRQAYERERIAARELAERTRILTHLHGLSERLDACQSLREAMVLLSEALPHLLPETSGTLAYRIDDPDEPLLVARWGSSPSPTPLRLEACLALHQQSSGSETPPGCQRCLLPQAEGQDRRCIPLRRADTLMGLLQVNRAPQPDTSQPGDKSHGRLMTIVADQLLLALVNLQLREALRQQALRDPLTGLYNRRYLDETFGEALAQASRTQTQLSIIMADIDHFKQINDTWGHPIGDQVLQSVAQYLRRNVRRDDIVCRAGGEEFVLLLPDTPLAVACERAEQLRAFIRAMPLVRDAPERSVTLSWGVACFPEHGLTPETLLARADAALYRAKATGRDRVLAAEV
jgi:diguanylate cyclase (GGDEF)-like protein